MKALKTVLLIINLLWWAASGALAEVTRDQALEKARAFLSSLGVTVKESLLEMDDLPTLHTTLGGHFAWGFNWGGASVYISVDSGEVLDFSNGPLDQACRDRYRSGEVPLMMTEEEVIRQAREFALKMRLPVSETQVSARVYPFNSTPSEDSTVGNWYITFRRFYQGYRTPDYFGVTIEPYQGRIVGLTVDWDTPMCEAIVNLTEEEATRLALEGFAARGISPIKDENHPPIASMMIVRPNYAWTTYAIPGSKVPFSRLAWLISVAQADGSPVGIVAIDAATGEWLGGDGVGGSKVKMKPAPPQTNAKAFLISRLLRSHKAALNALPNNPPVSITPQDKARWVSLAALLASLRPASRVPQGTGQPCLTLTGQEQTYALKQVGESLRLEGADVPGGSLGFEAGKDFGAKLASLAAPLAGQKQQEASKRSSKR